jgi:hypothetical protein
MAIKIFPDMLQGSDEWFEARRGILTASEMKKIITPKKLEYSVGEKEKAHLYELAAQRISGFVEPSYIGDDMLRGKEDEVDAVQKYSENYNAVERVGFMTNDKWGFTLGYSPDSLVGKDGTVEAKSRKQSLQIETIVTGIKDEHIIQLQTGLLVSERPWLDYISYCGGLPMYTVKVLPVPQIQEAIINAATIFHERLAAVIKKYQEMLADPKNRFLPTVRRPPEQTMMEGVTADE